MKSILHIHDRVFQKHWRTCVFALICLFSFDALGRVPTITDFSPTSGPIGTSVTITGTNFNTTATNNIVYFGAVKATINSANSTTLSVTVPIGATFAPITVTDTTTGLTSYSSAPFVVTFASSRIIDSTSLSGKVDFITGTGPASAAIAELDGDAKPDLIVTNAGSNTVSVYRNTSAPGSITSGSFATKVDFATGTAPYYQAIGDVDGDGKPNIVATNGVSYTLSVLRNTSTPGSISFAAKVDFPTGAGPGGVAIRDLDGDGRPELVVANSAGPGTTISVYRNTSTTGVISFSTKVDFTTGGTSPSVVAIADVDGDSKPDIVVNGNGVGSVFRNTSTTGSITSGSFATRVDLTTGNGPVDIFDADGDGRPDIVATDQNTNTLSLFRNTSTLGSITFAAKVNFPTSANAGWITIGDMDGDGKPDIVVTHYSINKISIYRNLSTSGNIDGTSLATRVEFSTGTWPAQVAIGDLDGDGKPDLVVANNTSNTVSVLRNTVAVPPSIASFSPTSGPIGTSVTITGTNFNTTAANNKVYFGATRATVTSASATSLNVAVPIGATFAPITVTDTTTGLTAYSSAPFVVTFASNRVIDANSFAGKVDLTIGTNPSFVRVADIDGDGKADLVGTNASSNSVSVLRNTSTLGNLSFAAKADFLTPNTPLGLFVGDVDGDGKLDIVVANNQGGNVSVFRNTSTSGNISFDPRIDLTAAIGLSNVALADLDGDGKPEIIVSSSGNAVFSVFKNSSTPGSVSFAPKIDFATDPQPSGLSIGDLDGDGKPDVVVTNVNSSTISVFRNSSTVGSISLDARVNFSVGTFPYITAIGDIDGDGKAEIVVSNNGSTTISVFRNTSTAGTITSASFAAKVDFTTAANPFAVAIGMLMEMASPMLS